MTFLNQILLLGLAALAIPVILHFFHRRRYRVLPWGAMQFLRASVEKRKRWLSLEQLILILIRMALVGTLAFLMARPALTSLLEHAGILEDGRAVGIILDASYSMDSPEVLEEARRAGAEILDSIDPEDTVALTLAAEVPRLISLVGDSQFDELRKSIQELRPQGGRARMSRALEMTMDALDREPTARREIYILSDLQAESFDEEEFGKLAEELEQRRGSRTVDLTIVDLASMRRALIENVSIDSVELPDHFLGTGEAIAIEARLSNRGGRPRVLSVRMLVDGEESAVEELTLEPRGRALARFRHVFDQAGVHRIEVVAEDGVLAADDRFFVSVRIEERLGIRVLDGDPGGDTLQSESGYLRLALSPRSDAKDRAPGFMDVDGRDWDGQGPLSLDGPDAPRVLVLADVPSMSEDAVRQLEQFVEAGGGLLIFLGDRMEASFYEGFLEKFLSLRLQPASGPSENPALSEGLRLVSSNHPAVEALRNAVDSLPAALIYRWLPVAPADPDAPLAALLELESGDPLLLESSSGRRGRVLLFTTAADDSWSNLPLRSFYLPLIQQCVLYLAQPDTSRAGPLNVRPGETLELAMPARLADELVTLRQPDGKEFQGVLIPDGEFSRFSFRATQLSGIYTAFVPREPPVYFAVNVGREESDTARVDETLFRDWAAGARVTLQDGHRGIESAIHARRFGVEIWKPLLALAVLLAFIELLAEQAFERGFRR